jgi:Glycosyltransferase family 87
LAHVRNIAAPLRPRRGWPRGPLIVAALLLAGGVLLRLPVFTYAGVHTQDAFNRYIFQHPGSYSDIASLYFRDHLWLHPAPYFDYRFEYPVVTGSFVWLLSFLGSTVTSYTLASWAVLAALALIAVVLVDAYEGSRVWILAAAPVLGLDVLLNWDVLAIALTAAALLAYQRSRDGWGGALLALAVWAKLFPLLLLPLIALARVREGRWRELARGLVGFAAVSALINLPVAFQQAANGGGYVVRSKWAYFYTFNERRRDVGGLWWFFGWLHPKAPEINRLSGLLMLLALAVVAFAMIIGSRRVRASSLVPYAFLALLAWFVFINKIYSPQFGLWVVFLLAIAGAPLWLAIPFVVIDTAFFWVSFVGFTTTGHWYFPNVIRPATGVREAVLLASFAWCIQRLARASPPLAPGARAGLQKLERPLAPVAGTT